MAIKREQIMMCAPFSIKRFESWGNQAYIQSKLNGERCRVVWDDNGNVTLHSSYNKNITSVPHILKALSKIEYRNVELDGELYKHGLPLQQIQSIVSRTVNLHPDHEQIELHIFDEVNSDTQYNRLSKLVQRTKLFKQDKISLVKSYHIASLNEANDLLNSFISDGFEGIVFRKIDGVYQRDIHSTQIMKLKPRKYDTYVIIGVKEEIDIYGTPKNALGAFICKAKDVNEEFSVGTGKILTREGREKYWAEKPIGKILHITYQELTPKGIPYCPVAYEILED